MASRKIDTAGSSKSIIRAGPDYVEKSFICDMEKRKSLFVMTFDLDKQTSTYWHDHTHQYVWMLAVLVLQVCCWCCFPSLQYQQQDLRYTINNYSPDSTANWALSCWLDSPQSATGPERSQSPESNGGEDHSPKHKSLAG